ncbi:MAG: hypothetical protein JOZ72_01290 [Alphaproteobacteria bacterium]|nr:hypothetical protein [Alphaproteobacteria bacterium]
MRRTKQALTVIANGDPRPLDADDLSDLPPELVAELSTPQVDLLERQIANVLEALGGAGDLDQILIGLYRRFQVVQKRRFLQNKLWRMVRKGLVLKTKSVRGVFRLDAPKNKRRRK